MLEIIFMCFLIMEKYLIRWISFGMEDFAYFDRSIHGVVQCYTFTLKTLPRKKGLYYGKLEPLRGTYRGPVGHGVA